MILCSEFFMQVVSRQLLRCVHQVLFDRGLDSWIRFLHLWVKPIITSLCWKGTLRGGLTNWQMIIGDNRWWPFSFFSKFFLSRVDSFLVLFGGATRTSHTHKTPVAKRNKHRLFATCPGLSNWTAWLSSVWAYAAKWRWQSLCDIHSAWECVALQRW